MSPLIEITLFSAAAAGALAGGVGVVLSAQPVRSALSLLLVLGSLAVMYLLLAAQFVATLQVIIYAGAIVVLFLFVIMLLHAHSGEDRPSKLRGQRVIAVVLSAAFYAAIVAVLRTTRSAPVPPVDAEFGSAQFVGRALFTAYVLPFELASIVLIVGIIAAVVIGRPHAPGDPLSSAASAAEPVGGGAPR
ncbi:MAG: NADH-quinone oxidoreductase subunit J family protein [bacterium]